MVKGVERRDNIYPGDNAKSPSADRAVGAARRPRGSPGGSITTTRSRSMTIAFAEDAFANDFRSLASTELEQQDATLAAYEASPEWTALGADDQTLFTQHALRVRSLLNRLRSHEDYYSNPLGWVPPLSLEANKLLFEQEVSGPSTPSSWPTG